MKKTDAIILFVCIICILVFIASISILLSKRKPEKSQERFHTYFLQTNLQLLKVKWDKTTDIISKEIGFDFSNVELALQNKQGLTITEINQIAIYFKVDKMILLYHDMRTDYQDVIKVK